MKVEEMEVALAFLIYALSIAIFALSVTRVNTAGRVFYFFLLFYSVAALFEFHGFQFFGYEVSYEWNPVVLFIYALGLWFGAVLGLVFFSKRTGNEGWFTVGNEGGLKALWLLSFFAWMVDLVFNWEFFFLPKHEYILSIPEQTKNLFVFTIPARELLAGAAVLSPFRGFAKKFAVLVGVLALFHSLVIGVRHVALLMLLLAFLPRMRSLGVIGLCLFATFFGEISNAVKLLLSPASGVQDELLRFAWWADYLSVNFGVSAEQKAILSNLLIKLAHPQLLELGRGVADVAMAFPFINRMGGMFGWGDASSTAAISSFVGVEEGQGTAYSLHLGIIEGFGASVPLIVLALVVARVVRGTMLFILAGEVMYSMMRNGTDYWVSQLNKLIFLIVFVWIISKFFRILHDPGNDAAAIGNDSHMNALTGVR